MLTVKAIVSSIPAQKLATADGVPELMAGILPYAERHFQRLDKLYTSSYLIDYTLLSMGNLDDSVAEDYSAWEANSKLVLPPSQVEGKTQVGGNVLVGKTVNNNKDEDKKDDTDEVITVGESESSSSESDSADE
jgi:U3 small nucleolar RNA-associated protein 13